jgi:hypothetical protein
MKVSGQLHIPAALPLGKVSLVPTVRRLGGHSGLNEYKCKKNALSYSRINMIFKSIVGKWCR